MVNWLEGIQEQYGCIKRILSARVEQSDIVDFHTSLCLGPRIAALQGSV